MTRVRNSCRGAVSSSLDWNRADVKRMFVRRGSKANATKSYATSRQLESPACRRGRRAAQGSDFSARQAPVRSRRLRRTAPSAAADAGQRRGDASVGGCRFSSRRPARRIPIRSHSTSTSLRMCDDNKTVCPLPCASRTHCRKVMLHEVQTAGRLVGHQKIGACHERADEQQLFPVLHRFHGLHPEFGGSALPLPHPNGRDL
jgi:hypothetical protein